MSKFAASFLILLTMSLAASAQDKPFSPPARPPVPMSSKDQERQRAEELAKKKAEKPQSAEKVKIPAALLGRHISSGNAAVDAIVYEAASQTGLDPCLIFSVMRAESGFNPVAVSPKGASGLMQLMPATASRFGVRNIFDARENIHAGSRYLRWLLDRFNGDLRLALAGYNAGEGAVEFYGLRIPPFLETQNYVRIIYARYSQIHAASAPPPVSAEARPVEAVKEKFPTYNQIIRSTSSTGDSSNGSPR
ncbi:MAG: lytic transglycosylase domain-containing protein [Acidobacteriota bacterium]